MSSYSTLESDEQERKLFVGGLNKVESSEEDLKQFFQPYGNIIDCTIMRDGDKQSRGFAFVLFETSTAVDNVIAAKREGKHFVLDEHHIEVKRALPKVPGGNAGSSRTGGLYKKIFVGGLPSTISEDDLRNYFERFGKVNEVELLRDRETNRLRGFAFVTFEDEDSADKCIQRRSHEICKKICEVKRAQTRSVLQETEDRRRGGDFNYFNRHDERHSSNVNPKALPNNTTNLSITEVNQLIQQAFVMGQQSVLQQSAVQPPTAASLLGLNAQTYTPPSVNNTHLLQALLGQQQHAASLASHAPIAPIAPPQVPVSVGANTQAGTLSQLARILQSGNIDPSALSALIKSDSEPPRNAGSTGPKASQNGYSTTYPPPSAYDLYYAQTGGNYGPTKDDSDSAKRSYRPY